ncbi:MAG: uroporphyrinogen decarboxylase family protein [Patescibacteria group bacterium]
MESREVVRRAIRHQMPPRVPVVNLWVDWVKWAHERPREEVERAQELMRGIPEDAIRMFYDPPAGWAPRKDLPADLIDDEWGVVWTRVSQRVVRHPLQEGWHEPVGFSWPDPDAPGRLDKAQAAKAANKEGRYFLGLVWFTLFERMWFMRGMENLLVDPLLDYESFKAFRDRMVEFNMRMIGHWLDLGVDGIFMSDDWGSQRGLLINPADWRRLYKPCYKEMFDVIKAAGADVWMHLCGDISSIIPDLIEIGLDVYNPLQPQAVDIAWLKREFGGHLCFNGGVDVQGTLPNGTPDEVDREVRMLISTLADKSGGYILGTSHTVLPDTPLANLEAMVRAIGKYAGNG